jgi:hypothetical protein
VSGCCGTVLSPPQFAAGENQDIRARARDWRSRIPIERELTSVSPAQDDTPRLIIDATSTADIKTKSRWTRALRYAWRERSAWTDLEAFLRKNGGPAGCATQFAAITKKNQSCIVYRYAGTGRPYLIIHKAA